MFDKNSSSNQSFEILNPDETIDNVLETIASATVQDRPFFVFNVDNLFLKYSQWSKQLPRVRPFYSIRCNDDDNVLQVLALLGAGFVCGSEREMRQVLSLGVDANDVIFGQPHKIISHLRMAARKGVLRMVFDCEAELQKIQENFPSASLILNINMADYDTKKGPLKLLKLAHNLSMDVVGLRFDVCSKQCSYFEAIKLGKKIFSEARFYGFNLKVLDLGDVPSSVGDYSFEDVALSINKGLRKYFPKSSSVEVVAEPGRFLVNSAFTLATAIYAKKVTSRNGEKYCMYSINDGVYGSFSQLLTKRIYVQPKIIRKAGNPTCKCTIWGPTCDSLDKVLEDADMPELDVGDWVFFENLGAYTKVLATGFNNFPKANTFSYISQSNLDSIQS